jgi:uncharacterized protein
MEEKMENLTRIFTDIDYNKKGKQIGYLYLPYSVTRSAYGNIAVPIAVIANGRGPTVLLQAGTHGDEYEGQIALCKLIRTLEAGSVAGRVIVLTATNLPAVIAGTRVSPLDGGNLNRAYPGDPDSGPTKAIAHYVDSVIFPMTDYHLDLHSGGSSLDYQPLSRCGAATIPISTAAQCRQCWHSARPSALSGGTVSNAVSPMMRPFAGASSRLVASSAAAVR